MSEMVERVARAVIYADAEAVENEIEPTSPKWAIALARAAIAAMREPSEGMLRAAEWPASRRHADAWKTMIGAALNDSNRK